jgi:hypothetical protein
MSLVLLPSQMDAPQNLSGALKALVAMHTAFAGLFIVCWLIQVYELPYSRQF